MRYYDEEGAPARCWRPPIMTEQPPARRGQSMRPATRTGRALWWAALLLAVPAAGVLAAHPLAAVAVIGSVWLFTVVRSTGRHVKGRPNHRKGGSWSPPSHVHLIDTSDHRAGR